MAQERIVRIILTGSSAGAVRAMAELDAAATKSESALSRVHAAGSKMASVGRQMTSIAVPLLAVGGYAVKTASDFQTSMTLIRTQVGAGATEVTNMTAAITKMAPKMGEGPNALAQALYPIESVGLRGAKALDALRAASMGAQISGASLTDTADAISGALRTQMSDVHSASDAMSIMNGIVAQGKMHLTDLTAALATGILPAAKNAGLSFRDVGDALAAMTRQGIPASDEATRLRLNLTQFEAPKNTALKALTAIGLGQFSLADDLRKPHGLITALLDLRNHLQGLTRDQKNYVLSTAFGGAKGSANVVGLLNALPQMQQIQTPLAAAGTSQLDKAFGLRTKDVSFQWDKLKATAQVALISIGNALMPLVIQYLPKLAHLVSDVAHWFTHLSKPVKEVVLGFVLFMAIGGPILTFLGTLIGAIKGVAGALEFLWANPIFLVIGALVALGVALVVAYNKLGWFRDFVNGVFGGIKSVVSSVVDFIKAHWQLLLSILTGPFGAAAIFIVTHFNGIVSFFAGIPKAIGNALSAVGGIITSIFGTAVNVIIDGINIVIKALDFLIKSYDSVVGSIPFIGGDMTIGTIGTIGHVNLGSSAPTAASKTSSQKVGSQPANSNNQTGHGSGAGAPIILHHTTKIGDRVVAEETVHYVAKRTSLGAAVLAR
jgi:TP901 family phage tail tape measure protein